MDRARAFQVSGSWTAAALLILAAFVLDFRGPTWLATSLACVAGIGLATALAAWIWEGATVPLLVSASLKEGGLLFKFENACDVAEFEGLNAAKEGIRAG